MGIAERKERERQMRRDMILQAAETVFFEEGLRAATLDDVAERAEVSKGTIYLYFSSKEDIYYALMIRGLRVLLKMFEETNPDELDPVGALLKFGNAYDRFSQSQAHLFRMLAIVEHSVVNEQVSPEVLVELEAMSDKVLSYVARFVEKGIEKGIFRNDLSAYEAVIMFWISMSGILNLRERSAMMRRNNSLDKDSILGKVDFASLYDSCQNYLIEFLTRDRAYAPPARKSAQLSAKSNRSKKVSKGISGK